MKRFDPNAAATPDSGIFGLTSGRDDSRVVLIPVPFEATTSYRAGTARGPSAILEASRQVDLYDYVTGRPYEAGIYLLPESKEILELNRKARRAVREIRGEAAPNKLQKLLDKVNNSGERLNEIVYEQCKDLIAEGKLVGVIGGDHSVPYGAIQAHAETYSGLGILHLDAHLDLREAYEGFTWSHASIMFNVITRLPQVAKLVQVGIRDFCEAELELVKTYKDRISVYFDEFLAERKFQGASWTELADRIVAELPENVYLSFDIDGLDPALCPNTGTPVPGGLSFQETVALLARLVDSGRKIVGFDLSEVAPAEDGKDNWDANVGARLLYKMIGYMLFSHRRIN
ncbi:MAG: agmatinase family protein [Acidobacteriota bacterium]|nr:agmatinase family protein [Blastocatellia bacterium]MDW8412074.1 agmatinase family protein [Acidobacteriota bacterium]